VARYQPLTPRDEADLRRLRTLADLLDNAFRVPGTSWRFGLDPLLGLIPGLGDVLGALFAGWGWLLARRIGAPPAIQRKMLVNIAIDMLGGAVPLVGDLFDAAFKAHVRNLKLLDDWLLERTVITVVSPGSSARADQVAANTTPARRSRAGIWVLLGILIASLVAVGLTIWLAVSVIRWLFG